MRSSPWQPIVPGPNQNRGIYHPQIKTNPSPITITPTYPPRTMLRSPQKSPSRRAANAFDMAESWPDETIVVLPETPRVRLSPRRKIMPQTPGWPPAHDMGDTIRMYHDSEPEDEGGQTLNFAMNQDFIESISPLVAIEFG
jgi:hypothetical protein